MRILSWMLGPEDKRERIGELRKRIEVGKTKTKKRRRMIKVRKEKRTGMIKIKKKIEKKKSPRKKRQERRQVYAATFLNTTTANMELVVKGANSTTQKSAPDSKGVEMDP